MGNMGWMEIVIILAVVLVLFLIPKKLPQLGRDQVDR
jgi:TatA/E family protein of Tat protein translocase